MVQQLRIRCKHLGNGKYRTGVGRSFQVRRECRDDLQLSGDWFTLRGDIILADYRRSRDLAWRINRRRDLARHPGSAMTAGELNAMGLIDEIQHYVIGLFQTQAMPQLLTRLRAVLQDEITEPLLSKTGEVFVDQFPPNPVYEKARTIQEYMQDSTDGEPHIDSLLEEQIVLWLDNRNPAFRRLDRLIDDQDLARASAWNEVMGAVQRFFQSGPTLKGTGLNLIDLLREPARRHPDSLAAQLRFMNEEWGMSLEPFAGRLAGANDLFREEEVAARKGLGGPGPVEIPRFDQEPDGDEEPERFTADHDWMPNVVLIARNAHVWLSQLSQRYQRDIHTLQQIPDEELAQLQQWGINALWLIGIWERSPASRQIKRDGGNPEALASAYSLVSYDVAQDLGGEAAWDDLSQRAGRYGIRLATDVVANHTGIDSDWVINHPDRFLSRSDLPFPGYTFTGRNLSPRPHISIQLEDGYTDRSDASVVFKREDHETGDIRYIYHGNDGTGMPWNDTAQINFLNPEAREAVIQSLLHVARRFSIIRLDAAMTLTRKHYQRLWFPEPGTGGDIPSRLEYGMTREEFRRQMPTEFWRDVVERIQQEVPDTLLLAEAFWLTESFFVRTLGMHRVYNSAFMNMLKAEDNAGFRKILKDILLFSPEILKRYVNFLSNPDEETAVSQFGKGDKYFGVTLLMVTLPGLPMFGHGQVEGLAEKYGMEYSRAYRDEAPDAGLQHWHEHFIFPLVRRRYLFSGVEHFALYDARADDGSVLEDVYAFSNQQGNERVLVLFNNRFGEVSGVIQESVPAAHTTRNIADVLASGLKAGWLVVRNAANGLQYLLETAQLQEQGLRLRLGAYQYQVIEPVQVLTEDPDGLWKRLADRLAGAGHPDIQLAREQIRLEPLLKPFRRLLSSETPAEADAAMTTLMQGVGELFPGSETECPFIKDPEQILPLLKKSKVEIPTEPPDQEMFIRIWWSLRRLHSAFRSVLPDLQTRWLQDWNFVQVVSSMERDVLTDRNLLVRQLQLLLELDAQRAESLTDMLQPRLNTQPLQEYLQVNTHDGVLWFSAERLQELLPLAEFLLSWQRLESLEKPLPGNWRKQCAKEADHWLQMAEQSGYRFDRLLELLQKPTEDTGSTVKG